MKSRKIHIVMYVIFVTAMIALTAIFIKQYKENKMMKIQIENTYQKSLYELTDYIEDIEINLRKTALVNSPAQLTKLSGDIFRLSNSAKSCMGELPISEIQLDNTSKFLSQVGDYTYVLSQSSINGETISDKQFEEIENLTKYASDLNTSLSKLRDGINEGSVRLLYNNGGFNSVKADGDILADLENVEKSFEDYPSLIYDGPFSEHIENRESDMIKSADYIDKNQAQIIASKFINTDLSNIYYQSETTNNSIDAYNFYCKEGKILSNISISKKGGFVIYYIKNREVKEDKLTFSEAISFANQYLISHGFSSMINSYYDKAYGVATINFAYVQSDTKCYSDLVKVKVAMDDGEIIGIETNGYLMNHKERYIEPVGLTLEQAQEKLNKHLTVQNSGLVIIPKDSLAEVLCYEFKGSFGGKNYLIYINAVNGREEKILMLLESENGILTE